VKKNTAPAAPAIETRLAGLAPVVSPKTVLLVLGSFPGGRSLAEGKYYAHPQNHFWKILQAIWPHSPLPAGVDMSPLPAGVDMSPLPAGVEMSPLPAGTDNGYSARLAWLLDRGLGLWDVYAECEREGSLDSAIRNPVVNDIAGLHLPKLAAIAHNGAESFKHARHTEKLGVPVYRLPSTSPANASWSFERKRDAWREVFVKHGLV
jgi:G:T/U-mismatch repair DNA glycosylase